jgi:hypothetical protein
MRIISSWLFLSLVFFSFSLQAAEKEAKVKPKPEAFEATSALVIEEKSEDAKGKVKVKYFIEVDGVKIFVSNGKKLKKFVGSEVTVSGVGYKKDGAWTKLTKVTKVTKLEVGDEKASEEGEVVEDQGLEEF